MGDPIATARLQLMQSHLNMGGIENAINDKTNTVTQGDRTLQVIAVRPGDITTIDAHTRDGITMTHIQILGMIVLPKSHEVPGTMEEGEVPFKVSTNCSHSKECYRSKLISNPLTNQQVHPNPCPTPQTPSLPLLKHHKATTTPNPTTPSRPNPKRKHMNLTTKVISK
jgi:hypothetical protein